MAALGAVSTELLSTNEHAVRTSVHRWRIHIVMLMLCCGLFGLSLAGSWRTNVWDFSTLIVAVLALPVSVLPALVWHDRGRYEKRDAALVLPWLITLALLMTLVIPLAGRMGFEFRDALLFSIDRALGLNTYSAVLWTSHHTWINAALNGSYDLLGRFLLLASVVPALTGKKDAAEQFLLANAIAFILSLPAVVLLPAIGPWVGYHFQGSASQIICEAAIRALHGGAAHANTRCGIITFPSFHVMWAVLCARALWCFRRTRIPVVVLTALIVTSTITTGWHYVSDVIGGLAVAAISLIIAGSLLRERCVTR